MKHWKRSGRKRRQPMGPQAARQSMNRAQKLNRTARNLRRKRAERIAAKRKVVPGG